MIKGSTLDTVLKSTRGLDNPLPMNCPSTLTIREIHSHEIAQLEIDDMKPMIL